MPSLAHQLSTLLVSAPPGWGGTRGSNPDSRVQRTGSVRRVIKPYEFAISGEASRVLFGSTDRMRTRAEDIFELLARHPHTQGDFEERTQGGRILQYRHGRRRVIAHALNMRNPDSIRAPMLAGGRCRFRPVGLARCRAGPRSGSASYGNSRAAGCWRASQIRATSTKHRVSSTR